VIWLLAHAAPINYEFPLPIWLYVVAGGAAVRVSAPAAAIGVRTSAPRERRGPDLYPLVRALRLGPIVTALLALLLVYGIVFGLAASNEQAHEFFENPMTLLTWVDFWVELGLLATFVGNVWDHVSPLNVAMRALDRVELFTVVSRTFARVAPLELRDDEARLRPFGAGLRTDPPMPAGGGAFVLADETIAVLIVWGITMAGLWVRAQQVKAA
jgi:hypothetical protein